MSTTRERAPGDLYDQLVLEDRVHRRIYTDQDIFTEEMTKVFGACWVYVGHASELTESNAFMTGTLGGRPIIITRDAGGDIHVLLNRCLHRGATVCRVERGRAKRFVCPYHGWSYANDGSLTGVPWPSGYAPEFDPAKYSLGRAKVAVYRDFIFATFNPSPPAIEDYLGAARPLVDDWVDRFSRRQGHRPQRRAPDGLRGQLEARHGQLHRRLPPCVQPPRAASRWPSGWERARTWRTSAERPGRRRHVLPVRLGNGHSSSTSARTTQAPGDYWATQRPTAGPGGRSRRRIRARYARGGRRACST